jgi:hypothetical protein
VAVALSAIAFTQTSQPLNVNGALINVFKGEADWVKVYGGSQDDRAFNAIPVGLNYLMVGSTKSAGNSTLLGWALMLNNDGRLLWNQTYLSGDGTELRLAVALSDGFLLVGNQYLQSDVNGYVAKINSQGDIIWHTVVGGAKIDKLFSGVISGDGFIVCGLSYSYGGNQSQAWAVKLDRSGSVIWNRVYGDSSIGCVLRSAVAASDGACVAAGYIDRGNSTYDFYLQEISSDGNLVWNQTYGGINSEKAYSIAAAPGGYVLAGDVTASDSPTDACITRVDSLGELVWNRTIGGSNADSAAFITPAKDGGYLVCGFTFSFGEGERDFWMFSIDDDGNVGSSCTYGDSAFQEAYAVIDAGNSKAVLFGWTDPIGEPDLVGNATYEFYIVKLNFLSNGPSLLTIALSVTIFALLVAALMLMLKLRRNKN